MKSSFIPTTEQLAELGITLTDRHRYHYPKDVIYQMNPHREVLFFPGGWQGMEIRQEYIEGEWTQIFRGEVQSLEEFKLVLRMILWIR